MTWAGSLDVVLGVDPGMSGALAWLNADGALLDAADMPVMDKRINVIELARLIRTEDLALAVVEQVHSMPGQGVASTFKFGTSYGAVLGVLGALHVRVEHVAPTVWKRRVALTGKEKDAARAKAIDRWPGGAHLFARKRDCGRADAAFIALHGVEVFR